MPASSTPEAPTGLWGYREAYRAGFTDGWTLREHIDTAGERPRAAGLADGEQSAHGSGGEKTKQHESSKGSASDDIEKRDANAEGDDDGSSTRKDAEKGRAEEKQPAEKDDDKTKPRAKWPFVVLVVVIVVLAIGGFTYWMLHRNIESTDDAFTDGDAVSIAPKITGYVTTLAVTDNMFVHRGDLLLAIDRRDYDASLAKANADLGLAKANLRSAELQLSTAQVQIPSQLQQALAKRDSAEVNLAKARATATRQHEVDPRATSREAVDAADANRDAAAAALKSAQADVDAANVVRPQIRQAVAAVEQRKEQVAAAQANVDQGMLTVGYTELRAPIDGYVTKRNVQLGSYLQAGTEVMAIVSPNVWVTANFKESQLERMRPGDRTRIKVDAYPNLDLEGHVDSIQRGSGSRFSAFPAENATGNFVKIVQRVPVKILVDRGLEGTTAPLPLGLSVVPSVTVQ